MQENIIPILSTYYIYMLVLKIFMTTSHVFSGVHLIHNLNYGYEISWGETPLNFSILSLQASCSNIIDSCYEETERIFYQFSVYHMKILLCKFYANNNNERIFFSQQLGEKQTSRN